MGPGWGLGSEQGFSAWRVEKGRESLCELEAGHFPPAPAPFCATWRPAPGFPHLGLALVLPTPLQRPLQRDFRHRKTVTLNFKQARVTCSKGWKSSEMSVGIFLSPSSHRLSSLDAVRYPVL